MADGVGSRGARIGDDRDRPGKTECSLELKRLVLRLVFNNPCRLAPPRRRLFRRMPKKGLPFPHATAGRAEHKGEIFSTLPTGAPPRFIGRMQQEPGSPI